MHATEGGRVDRLLLEYDRAAPRYERFCADIEALLRKLIESLPLRVSSVTSRVKERDSFKKKVQNDKYQSARDVTDLAGVRVVTYFEDDVDKVASVIKDHFEVDVSNSVNKSRTLPIDQFGYRSSHFVVSLTPERSALRENQAFAGLKVEIQVRSLLQHAWAEVEHGLGYKAQGGLPASIARRFYRLASLLEIADEGFVGYRQEAVAVAHELPACRHERIAELVEDFRIDIPYNALPPELNQAGVPLLLRFNTNVTNRVSAGGQTEVQLYVEKGSAAVENAKGRLIGVNALSFAGIFPIVPRPNQDSIRLCISGLRINAVQLAAPTLMAQRFNAMFGPANPTMSGARPLA